MEIFELTRTRRHFSLEMPSWKAEFVPMVVPDDMYEVREQHIGLLGNAYERMERIFAFIAFSKAQCMMDWGAKLTIEDE